MNRNTIFKPRLLRETAEIALTEIKRYIEPRIVEELSLRRVSAPLYLPADSDETDPGEAVRFRLPDRDGEMVVVRGLDRWLRRQLLRYDIAPGFGVFTVMNALRPEVAETATTSPHLSAWSWQQVLAAENANADYLVATGKRIYEIFEETEQMILGKFPHLEATLPQRIHVIRAEEIREKYPDMSQARAEYLFHREMPDRVLLVVESDMNLRVIVWNNIVRLPITLAQLAVDTHAPVSSIGGTIFRDPLAMQILHQPHLLR